MNHDATQNRHQTPSHQHSDESHLPAFPLMEAIAQIKEHLLIMPDKEYTEIPSNLFTSTPGAQVRHTLDHIGALLHGIQKGVIEYDIRERGSRVENSRFAALELMESQYEQLKQIKREDLSRPVIARLLMDPRAEILEHPSSVSREIVFVLSHTIHHNAILLSMFRFLGRNTADEFGFAPATIAYKHSLS